MLNSVKMRKLKYDELAFIEIPKLRSKPFEPLKAIRSSDPVRLARFRKSF